MFKQPNFNKVLVLDTNRKPLMPCYPARARKLLEKGRASVFRRYPFTIIIHDRTVEESALQDVEIKIDQGSKTTGVALVVYGHTTSKNRIALDLPKDRWIDAAVCTDNGVAVKVDPRLRPLIIKATGRGSRQFCRMDRYGFPRTSAKPRTKNFFGFKTGDMVKATISIGAKTKVPIGIYIGRVAVRSSGRFDVSTKDSKIAVSQKYCKLLHQMDGYAYED